ncbi:LysE family translocator [Enterovibrio norvegicus]|uniref:LysE family translocator n=1 Tax=Enterovibrio norvegicus TaxID=188144 RepID=UPI000C8273E2|nr:LysE family transporter [Enterovibrio norvegicus]PML80415.1 transporter [Enterovibrio norvegicus]
MFEIWTYAFGIMYSPGPVNFLGLNGGVNGKTKQNLGFFAGVGVAMLLLFLSLGFLGNSLISPNVLPYTSLLGSGYILYLASKLLHASFQQHSPITDTSEKEEKHTEERLRFRQGLTVQLLNPKGLVATLPIVTIQFPAADISGMTGVLWSVALSILAFGAPLSYSLIGGALGRQIENPRYFAYFTRVMAVLLAYVAVSICIEHSLSVWFP